MKAYIQIDRKKLGEYIGAVIALNGRVKSETSLIRSGHIIMKVEYRHPQDLFELGKEFALQPPIRTR